MSGMNWEELSLEERLVAEQAVMNMRSLTRACRAAAPGTVLSVAENMAMDQGRELIRQTLESSLKAEASEVEKKGRRVDHAVE